MIPKISNGLWRTIKEDEYNLSLFDKYFYPETLQCLDLEIEMSVELYVKQKVKFNVNFPNLFLQVRYSYDEIHVCTRKYRSKMHLSTNTVLRLLSFFYRICNFYLLYISCKLFYNRNQQTLTVRKNNYVNQYLFKQRCHQQFIKSYPYLLSTFDIVLDWLSDQLQ